MKTTNQHTGTIGVTAFYQTGHPGSFLLPANPRQVTVGLAGKTMVLASILVALMGWWPSQPMAAAEPPPPSHLQISLEFSPKLDTPDLPAALNPIRVKIAIDGETGWLPPLTGTGEITLGIEFADQTTAIVAGPFTWAEAATALTSDGLTLSADTLAPFLPQPLTWQGRADYDGERLQVNGLLSLTPKPVNGQDQALELEHRILLSGKLAASKAEIRLPEVNLPLSQLSIPISVMEHPAWPDSLPELQTGKLSGQVNLAYPENQLQLTGQLQLREADGIYQTSFFRDLKLVLPFSLEDDLLVLPAIELEISEFNPGIALGPVKAGGHYRAPLASPGQGRLTVKILEVGILGGRFKADPFSLTPGQEDLRFVLRLEGLELAQLLAVHPVEGLTGTGRIDGYLPLRLQEGKISLIDGQLTARSPGGVINYESTAAAALTRRNPALKLVLDALSNFHYNALTAEATYLEDGTLLLGLRLEGNNPEVERGRPIVLEINLQENLPALLAGLQLTNRISDTIRQRIEERYR